MPRPNVSDWLRSETPGNLELLTKLRVRLMRSMDVQRTTRGGEESFEPPDVNEFGTMSRDWCRALERYQAGYHALLVEERERAKLRLLAAKSGQATLTDEEYDREMKELGLEAVRELSTGDLASEFLRRGMSIPVSVDDRDDPD